MFLSPEQLRQLTDRERASAQLRWLQAHRWAYTVTADGRPIVAVAEAERQLCTGLPDRARSSEPDLAALDRLG